MACPAAPAGFGAAVSGAEAGRSGKYPRRVPAKPILAQFQHIRWLAQSSGEAGQLPSAPRRRQFHLHARAAHGKDFLDAGDGGDRSRCSLASLVRCRARGFRSGTLRVGIMTSPDGGAQVTPISGTRKFSLALIRGTTPGAVTTPHRLPVGSQMISQQPDQFRLNRPMSIRRRRHQRRLTVYQLPAATGRIIESQTRNSSTVIRVGRRFRSATMAQTIPRPDAPSRHGLVAAATRATNTPTSSQEPSDDTQLPHRLDPR